MWLLFCFISKKNPPMRLPSIQPHLGTPVCSSFHFRQYLNLYGSYSSWFWQDRFVTHFFLLLRLSPPSLVSLCAGCVIIATQFTLSPRQSSDFPSPLPSSFATTPSPRIVIMTDQYLPSNHSHAWVPTCLLSHEQCTYQSCFLVILSIALISSFYTLCFMVLTVFLVFLLLSYFPSCLSLIM